jgi:murein DD-endopeptidase MepM/ murein hydrolase activator NlpD
MGSRTETTAGRAVAVLTLSVLALGAFIGCNDDEPAEVAAASAEVPAIRLHVVEDTLSSGQSLYTSLVGEGIDASRAVEVLDVLGKSVNLRSCKPGDSYTAEMSDDGTVVNLCYRRGLRELYKVNLDSSGYAVAADTIPLTVLTRRVEGVLETCLWEACLEAGEDPQIALKLSDVLGWEIDFVTDPRRGDAFTMIYEELYCEGRKVGLGDVIGAVYVNEGEEHTAIGFPEPDGTMEYYDPDGNSVRRVFLKSPLNYRRISSYFSNRRFHPILKTYRPHHGVDYAAPTGTPIVSIGDGRVTRAGWNGGFGNYVEIRHNNIYTSCYGHLSKYGRGVRGGVRVKQGQIVGYVGSTGLSTGPHLDFRVKKYGSYVNPLTIDYPRGEPVDEEYKEAFFARRDLILRGLKYRELAAADSSGA